MAVDIFIKRGTFSELQNIVLESGEPAYDTDNDVLKIGNGSDTFEDLVLPSSSSSKESVFSVDNHTGNTIYKGQAVYASGVTAGGKVITIDKYAADGSIDAVRFIGLAKDDILTGELGEVLHFGNIRHIDTRTTNQYINPDAETWQVGDILYVHPTVSGGLTKNKPQIAIYVAMVLLTGNNGDIFVRLTNFGDLNDKNDVLISSPASGDGLIYNSSTTLWENKTVPQSDISNINGNASGVYNIVIVDQTTYNNISPKDPNTIYFVP